MSVRVRFAPSPTGSLHVGGARTALFNFLFAKKYKGKFILRVEDTDQERNKEEFLKEQLLALDWLGLNWDEGPCLKSLHEGKKQDQGLFGPYWQSQRTHIYQQYAEKLLKEGKAYYCFLTSKEIARMKEQAQHGRQAFRVQSEYRDWSLEKSLKRKSQGDSAVIRFKVPSVKKEYQIQDGVRGRVSFPSDMVGDFVLLRSSGQPVYNFCCAVDDALMKITHVFRAEEHLANTLRQLMVFSAFDFPSPQYFHLSLILDEEKKKLSKRAGALSCLEYRNEGYVPSALNNFLALLGWSSEDSKEVLSFGELEEKFSEKRLNPAGAVFDQNKMRWINAQHLRMVSDDVLWEWLEPFLKESHVSIAPVFLEGKGRRSQALSVLKTSFSTLKEAVEVFRLLSEDFYQMEKGVEEIEKWPSSRLVLERWKKELENKNVDYLLEEDFRKIQSQIKENLKVKGKFLFMPLRVAVIGRMHGFELYQVVPLVRRSVLLSRVNQVLAELF